jgi:hypothetical protein
LRKEVLEELLCFVGVFAGGGPTKAFGNSVYMSVNTNTLSKALSNTEVKHGNFDANSRVRK